MSKRISILGSTGSIGTQSLEVIEACGMEVAALTANSSVKLMEEQARKFNPELAVLMDEQAAADLRCLNIQGVHGPIPKRDPVPINPSTAVAIDKKIPEFLLRPHQLCQAENPGTTHMTNVHPTVQVFYEFVILPIHPRKDHE